MIKVFAVVLLLTMQPLFEGDPVDKAWSVLHKELSDRSADHRAKAVHALGYVSRNANAEAMVTSVLGDPSADIRVEAAHALARMDARGAVPKLKRMLNDRELKVVIAAADALYALKDPTAYQVYFALLTGERKSSEGLLESQMDTLRDRKQLEKLAFETGIGFVPFGGMGWEAWKTVTQDDASPVKASAAEKLASDPDPRTSAALEKATLDKKWRIRAAAAVAIQFRGDVSLLNAAAALLLDENDTVRCQAAAAVLSLSKKPRPDKAKPFSTGLLGSSQ